MSMVFRAVVFTFLPTAIELSSCGLLWHAFVAFRRHCLTTPGVCAVDDAQDGRERRKEKVGQSHGRIIDG